MKQIFLLFTLLLLSLNLSAYEDESLGYETIVDQLNKTSVSQGNLIDGDPFDTVKFYSGIGVIVSIPNVKRSLDNNKILEVSNLTMEGVELNLGIDLFSPRWLAEGSYRTLTSSNSNSSNANANANFTLSEFDLKLIYNDNLGSYFHYKVGGGLAARYLTVAFQGNEKEYTTPSSILSTSIGAKVSNLLTLSLEGSYRAAFISDTIDDSAVNAGIRVDANF